MKPKPLSALNHFTVPTGMSLSLPPSSRRYRPTPTRTLTPTARDKLDLQVANQNVNLCQLHASGCEHCPLPNPGPPICRSADAGCVDARDPPQLLRHPDRNSRVAWRGRGDQYALAGLLHDVIGPDVTAAIGRCGNCGRAGPMAKVRVFDTPPAWSPAVRSATRSSCGWGAAPAAPSGTRRSKPCS